MHVCSIANIYQQQGKISEALELYHKSLAIKEKIHGCDHLDTAATREKYAVLIEFFFCGRGHFIV